MLILDVKEMTNAFPIHVIILVIVLIYGKHSVVHVKDHILEILVNTVSFFFFLYLKDAILKKRIVCLTKERYCLAFED